jgi:aldehyde:ferredoxin oxidoreductase
VSNEELMRAAERSWNLKRCFNVREGLTRKDDRLPRKMFEPLPDGPNKGQRIKDLEGLLDEYYEALGWDPKTGIPRPDTLRRLDLEGIGKSLCI